MSRYNISLRLKGNKTELEYNMKSYFISDGFLIMTHDNNHSITIPSHMIDSEIEILKIEEED